MPAPLGHHRPDKAARNCSIIADYISGNHPKDIAIKHHLSERQTYHILSDDQVRDKIDRQYRIYAAHIPAVGREFLKLCYSKDEKIRTKNIESFHRIMRISPTPTGTQIFMQTNITQVNPELAAMQAHVSGDLMRDDEVQDADIEEIDA